MWHWLTPYDLRFEDKAFVIFFCLLELIFICMIGYFLWR